MILPLIFISTPATVVEAAPTANFVLENEFTEIYTSVSAEDQSSGNPSEWRWYINGVFHSSSRNTSFWFPRTGIYRITLDVENVYGADSMNKYVEVYDTIQS